MLSRRLADDFIPESVSVQLFNLSEEGHTTKEDFLKLSHAFYSTAVAYLNAWGKHVDDLKDLQCLIRVYRKIEYVTPAHIFIALKFNQNTKTTYEIRSHI